MKIGMACDHGAYTYKEEIKQMLIDEGHEVVDCGCHDTNSVGFVECNTSYSIVVLTSLGDKGADVMANINRIAYEHFK